MRAPGSIIVPCHAFEHGSQLLFRAHEVGRSAGGRAQWHPIRALLRLLFDKDRPDELIDLRVLLQDVKLLSVSGSFMPPRKDMVTLAKFIANLPSTLRTISFSKICVPADCMLLCTLAISFWTLRNAFS